jgi:hypothetical protein
MKGSIMDAKAARILTQSKSVGLAVVLTIIFGGFGLLYASIGGGILMLILEILAWVVTILTLGLGAPLLIILHIVSLIWAIVSTNSHNKRLITG